MPGNETLLSPSSIFIFGRVVDDIKIDTTKDHEPFVVARGGNKLLQNRLAADPITGAPQLARIYGFSYEGTYYDLPRPMLFLVHGAGESAESLADARGGAAGNAASKRVARAPDSPSRTGLAAPDFSFADDLKVWSYDKADYTIRMDVETGMFEQVLLNMVFGGDGGGPGVSGAYVSGAYVSGAYVSGAYVGGRRPGGPRGRGRRGEGTD